MFAFGQDGFCTGPYLSIYTQFHITMHVGKGANEWQWRIHPTTFSQGWVLLYNKQLGNNTNLFSILQAQNAQVYQDIADVLVGCSAAVEVLGATLLYRKLHEQQNIAVDRQISIDIVLDTWKQHPPFHPCPAPSRPSHMQRWTSQTDLPRLWLKDNWARWA